MKKPGRPWWRYSPEFKQQAVQRMLAGEGVSGLARELGIRRKFLYEWRDQGLGQSTPAVAAKTNESGGDEERGALQRANVALQRRVSELERLVGQQSGELSFFAAALRSVEELTSNKGKRSGGGSIELSKTPRKAEKAW